MTNDLRENGNLRLTQITVTLGQMIVRTPLRAFLRKVLLLVSPTNDCERTTGNEITSHLNGNEENSVKTFTTHLNISSKGFHGTSLILHQCLDWSPFHNQ